LNASITQSNDFIRIYPALYAIHVNGFTFEQTETLQKKVFDYICQVDSIFDHVTCDKEKIDQIIFRELLPYYGEFHRSRSREISFLPLSLRLYIYYNMFGSQRTAEGQVEVLDRISITLAKMGHYERAKMAEAMKLLYIPGNPIYLRLLYAQCQSLDELYNNRKDFFKEYGLNESFWIDELKMGLNAFSDIHNFNELEIAPSILRLFEAYFPVLAQDKEYLEAFMHYVTTGDRSMLEVLNINPVLYAKQKVQQLKVNQKAYYEESVTVDKLLRKNNQK